MGLSYSPGGASWSYEEFHQLRKKVAELEGIDDLESWWKNPMRDGEGTPLYAWLDSEDVQGFFTASQCERMVPRFRSILKHLGSHFSALDRQRLEALVCGMEHCVEHGCAMSWG